VQKDVAKILNVSTDTITGWENNRTEPQIQFMPNIIDFIGYLPVQIDGTTIAGKVKAIRMLKGMSQRKLGAFLNIDPSTIESIENEHHKPSRELKDVINSHFNNLNKRLLK
jgi:DNA-binding XRE family transcriptional regulator